MTRQGTGILRVVCDMVLVAPRIPQNLLMAQYHVKLSVNSGLWEMMWECWFIKL